MTRNKTTFFTITVATAIAYFLVAVFSQMLADSSTETTTVWLSAGVTFGAILTIRQQAVAAIVVGSWVASLIWAFAAHQLTGVASLALSVIDPLSVLVGAAIAVRIAHGQQNSLLEALGLIAGALVTAALGATLAAEFWHWQRPDSLYSKEWRTWAFSTAVGVLLVAPLMLGFRGFQIKRSGGMPMQQFVSGALLFAAFVAVTGIVFAGDAQQRFSSVAATLGYLPMPLLLLTALLWGPPGGAFATLAGALLVIVLTGAGGGPFHVANTFTDEAVIEVQAYVSVWAMLVLLAQGLANARRAALADAKNWRLRYERIMRATAVVSVEFDMATGDAVWSDNVASVLNVDPATLSRLTDWMGWLAANDRTRAEDALQAITRGVQIAVTANFHVRDELRPAIEATLAGVAGPDGTIERIAGVLRTVPSTSEGGVEVARG